MTSYLMTRTVAILVALIGLSACSDSMDGQFKTIDGQALRIQSQDEMTEIKEGAVSISLSNNGTISDGSIKITNKETDKSVKIKFSNDVMIEALDFNLEAQDINQSFSLAGQLKSTEPVVSTYESEEYCTTCGYCSYTTTQFDSKGNSSIQTKFGHNCDCSGRETVLREDTKYSTSVQIDFIQHGEIIAQFNSEPQPQTDSVVKEVLKMCR